MEIQATGQPPFSYEIAGTGTVVTLPENVYTFQTENVPSPYLVSVSDANGCSQAFEGVHTGYCLLNINNCYQTCNAQGEVSQATYYPQSLS